MRPPTDSFGERVRYLRGRVPELSQSELDHLAGLHRGHVWQIEQGNRDNPTSTTASALAAVFGVSLDWLMNGRGEMPDDVSLVAAVSAARTALAEEKAKRKGWPATTSDGPPTAKAAGQ